MIGEVIKSPYDHLPAICSEKWYNEDTPELKELTWSISNMYEGVSTCGKYCVITFTKFNDVDFIFDTEVPDGEYPFTMNDGISTSDPVIGTMLIKDQKVDIAHLNTQIPKGYGKNNFHTFIEQMKFEDGVIEILTGS